MPLSNAVTDVRPRPGTQPGPALPEPPRSLQQRFEILELLGQGGQARVYLARDLVIHRPVALKLLHPTSHQSQVSRFQREGQMMARLKHPNLVQVFDAGETEGCRYLVMEYIHGESLFRRLARVGRLDVREALSITLDCLSGLGACHAEGIVHRDIKPGNILLESSNLARIADLGLARRPAGETPLTAPDVVMGTPLYLAPEQIRGEIVSPATDIYAMGIVLFQMLSGAHPLVADNAGELLRAQLGQSPRDLTQLVPELPSGLTGAIAWALSKEPGRRPQSVAEWAAALEPLARTRPAKDLPRSSGGRPSSPPASPSSPGPDAGPIPSSRRARWVGGFFMASLAIAVLGGSGSRTPAPPAGSPAVSRSPPAPDPTFETLDRLRKTAGWPVLLRSWKPEPTTKARCPLVVCHADRVTLCRITVTPGSEVIFPSGLRLTHPDEVPIARTGLVEGINWVEVEKKPGDPLPWVTLVAVDSAEIQDRSAPPPDFDRFFKATTALRADPTYMTTGSARVTVLQEYRDEIARAAALERVEMTRLAAVNWLSEQAGAQEEDVLWDEPEINRKALETLELYQALIRKSPDTWEAWLELTWILCRVGQLEQSQIAALRMLEIWPRGYWGWQTLGRLQRFWWRRARREGALEEAARRRLLAIAAYREALRLVDASADPKSHQESTVDLENLMR